ncbi:MAG: orotate phosphoribosyltransferase [Candidatus Methanomethylicota archaeon]|uniref:Orotate phosphoribosyltransferase n=1 Tax=Thermoproteota archaeon TaxID=2056631 RepID=A0A497EMG9_9CREN|nr:MAG: orotate phosphoribosyltransferase [Candidatus Verstraetearchaeota archaeon]
MKKLLNRDELAKELFEKGCIAFGEFTLSAGGKSPYYIDLRRIPSYPELYDKVTDLYVDLLHKLDFDKVVGIATAGIPIAALTAYKLNKPFLYVRKEAKDYGLQKQIEGVLERGDKVVVVDDVITTGSNIIRAVDAIRSAGAVVNKAVVLVDREQGGSEALRKLDVELLSIVKASQLVESLYNLKLIDDKTYHNVMAYIRASST